MTPGHGVAGVQVELADLRRRDVDVVGAGQVVVVGRAQEAEAVGQRLEHAFGEDRCRSSRRARGGSRRSAPACACRSRRRCRAPWRSWSARRCSSPSAPTARSSGPARSLAGAAAGRRGRRAAAACRQPACAAAGAAAAAVAGFAGFSGLAFLSGGGGGYAAVRLGRLAIIFHSSSSPSPSRAETSGTGMSKQRFEFTSMTRAFRARQLVDLGADDALGAQGCDRIHAHASRSDSRPGCRESTSSSTARSPAVRRARRSTRPPSRVELRAPHASPPRAYP